MNMSRRERRAGVSDNHMHAPLFKWELNANTIPIIIIIFGGLIGYGYFVSEFRYGLSSVTKTAEMLQADVRRIDESTRRVEALEFRLNAAERRAMTVDTAMDTVKARMAELSSDMRLTREILERMERQLSGNGYAPAAPRSGYPGP
jgi:hypothetical protein